MHPRIPGYLGCTLVAGLLFVGPAASALANPAKDYPHRPVRFLVQVVSGGGSDTTARVIAQKLSELWGHQVVVDNRPGASGAIAMDIIARAAPDGYTIGLISASQSVLSAVNPNLPFDLTKDFAAISQVTSLFYVLYHSPSVPVKSIKEFIAYGKANPQKLNYGTSGNGSLQHLGIELFSSLSGARFAHVPYKGSPAAISAALSGDIQFGLATLFNVRPHMQTGRLRTLAITAKKRFATVPEIPTMAEAGVPGYELDSWYGVATNAKTPAVIIKKLNAGIVEALKSADVLQRLGADGSAAVGSSPGEFAAHMTAEIAKWRKLIKDAGLVLN